MRSNEPIRAETRRETVRLVRRVRVRSVLRIVGKEVEEKLAEVGVWGGGKKIRGFPPEGREEPGRGSMGTEGDVNVSQVRVRKPEGEREVGRA